LVGVVGDITPEELAPILDTVFGALPATGAADPVPAFDGAPPSGVVVADLDVPQSTIMFARRGLAIDDPRYYVGMVLNQCPRRWVLRRSTEPRKCGSSAAWPIPSTASSTPWTRRRCCAAARVPKMRGLSETLDVIREVFTDIQENGLPEDRIADAKTFLTGSYPLRFTSSSQHRGGNWRRCSITASGSTISTPETISSRRSPPTHVNALAAELLDPDGLLFVVVGAARRRGSRHCRCPKGEGASSAPPAHRSLGFPNRSWDPDRFERFALDRHETVLRRRADRPEERFHFTAQNLGFLR
jgi:zinc protease